MKRTIRRRGQQVGLFKRKDPMELHENYRPPVYIEQVNLCAQCGKLLMHYEEIAYFSDQRGLVFCWDCKDQFDQQA